MRLLGFFAGMFVGAVGATWAFKNPQNARWAEKKTQQIAHDTKQAVEEAALTAKHKVEDASHAVK